MRAQKLKSISKIVVNPKLVEYAQEMAPEIASRLENIDQIKIIQDKAVSADGVVVESVSKPIFNSFTPWYKGKLRI